MPRSLKNFIAKLQSYSNRWWYVPLMCFLVFIDLFVVVIPSEAVMIKTIILKPKRWFAISTAMILSSAIGAITLGYLVQTYGHDFVRWLLGNVFGSPEWFKTEALVNKYGSWGLGFISFSPLPQQIPVVVCALAKMPLWKIFAAVALGRAPKYYLFALLALKFPHLYEKYLKKIIEDAFSNEDEEKKKPQPPEDKKP